MLRALKDMEGFRIEAADGTIGKVVNFLFDDNRWVVRYLVVETGDFLDRRRVLISPISFGETNWVDRSFHVLLTVAKVAGSPSIDTDLPVSRQHETKFLSYYGYTSYWGASGIWGMGGCPQLLMGDTNIVEPTQSPVAPPPGDPNLRSIDEVCGYHVEGNDDAIGHVSDFVVDDVSWEIIDIVVDTRNWWFGKHVVVGSRYANYIDGVGKKLFVKLSRGAIEASPEWSTDTRTSPDHHA